MDDSKRRISILPPKVLEKKITDKDFNLSIQRILAFLTWETSPPNVLGNRRNASVKPYHIFENNLQPFDYAF